MAVPKDREILEVHHLYERFARDYDRDRDRSLLERGYLDAVLVRLGKDRRVLDLGCGSGEPIVRYLIEAGCEVTGVDAAPAMIDLCRSRFPEARWQVADMRSLALPDSFDAIIAWDSIFHLRPGDQRRMFEVFQSHIAPKGVLLFSSGPEAGEAIGDFYGHALFHASLDPQDYEALLHADGFEVLQYRAEDPDCGGHTVWLARSV